MVNKYFRPGNLSGISFIPPGNDNYDNNQYNYYKKRQSSGIFRSAVIQTIGTLTIPLIINTVGRATLGGISNKLGALAAKELETKTIGNMAKKISTRVFGTNSTVTRTIGRATLKTARRINYAYEHAGVPASSFLESMIEKHVATPYRNVSHKIANTAFGGERSFIGKTFIRATEEMASDLPLAPYLYYMYMKDQARTDPDNYQKNKGMIGAAKWYVKSLPSQLVFGRIIRGGIGVTNRAIQSSTFKSLSQIGKITLGNSVARASYLLNNLSSERISAKTNTGAKSLRTFTTNLIKSVKNINEQYETLVNRSGTSAGVKNLVRYFTDQTNVTNTYVENVLNSNVFKSFVRDAGLTKVTHGETNNNIFTHYVPTRTINGVNYDLTRYNIAQSSIYGLLSKVASIPLGRRFGNNPSLIDFVGLGGKINSAIAKNDINVIETAKDNVLVLNEKIAGKDDFEVITNFLGISCRVSDDTNQSYNTIEYILNAVEGGREPELGDKLYRTIGNSIVNRPPAASNSEVIGRGKAIVDFVRSRFTINNSEKILTSPERITNFVNDIKNGVFKVLSNEAVVTAGEKTFLLNKGMNVNEGINRINPFYFELGSASNLKIYSSNSTTGKAIMQMFKARPGIVGYGAERPVEIINIKDNINHSALREWAELGKSSNLSIFQKLNNIFARKQSYYNPDVFFSQFLSDSSFRSTVKTTINQSTDENILKEIDNTIQLAHEAVALEKSKEFVSLMQSIDRTKLNRVPGATYVADLFVTDETPITQSDMIDRVTKLVSIVKNAPNNEGISLNLRGELEALSTNITALGSDAAIKQLCLDSAEYKNVGTKKVNLIDYYNSLVFQTLSVPKKINIGSIGGKSTESLSLLNFTRRIVALNPLNANKMPGVRTKDGVLLNDVINKWYDSSYINTTFDLIEWFNKYQTDVMQGNVAGKIGPAQNEILENIATAYGVEDLATDKIISSDFMNTIHKYFNYSGKNALKSFKHNINVTVEAKAPGAVLISRKKSDELATDANAVALTIASHVNNTLSELGIGFAKNFTNPLQFYTKLITKRILPGAIGVAGLSLADSFFRSVPLFNGTPLGGGISGLAMDVYANTKIASYTILDMLGVTDAAYNLEQKYPGIIDSPASGLVRGVGPVIAGLRYGGIPGAAVGLSAGVLFGGGPAGIMDDWDISKSRDDIIAEFTGEKDVPIRRDRWWMLSFSPIRGTGVQYYRPHSYALNKSKYTNASNMKGSFADRIIGTFIPSYYTYKDMYSRPYPIVSNGRVSSPVAGMVAPLSNELRGTDEISLNNELEYATSLNDITLKLDQQIFSMSEMAGLAGFATQEMAGINEMRLIPEVPSPQINSFYRDYWNMNLGDIAGFCLSKNTMITTENGYVSIDSIKPGDMVLTKEGTYNKVIHKLITPHETWSKKHKMLKITTPTTTIHMTDNHWVPVTTLNNIFINFITEVQAKNINNIDSSFEKMHYVLYPITKRVSSAPTNSILNIPPTPALAITLGAIMNRLIRKQPIELIVKNDNASIESVLHALKLNYFVYHNKRFSSEQDNIPSYFDYNTISINKDISFFIMLTNIFSVYDMYPIPDIIYSLATMTTPAESNLTKLFINNLLSSNPIITDKVIESDCSLELNNYCEFSNIFNYLLLCNIIPSCIVDTVENKYSIAISQEFVSNEVDIGNRKFMPDGIPVLYQNKKPVALIYENILYTAILNIEEDQSYTYEVYDLTIDFIHTFVANNIIVHNTEPLRRFIPHKSSNVEYYNPIPNAQPVWIPNSGIYSFKEGDPYTKIEMGEIRLPGPAYNILHRPHYTVPLSGFSLGLTPEEQYNFYLGSPKYLNMFNQERVLSERMVDILKDSNRLFQAEAVYSKRYNLDVTVEGMLRTNNIQLPLAIGASPATYSRLNAYLVLKNLNAGMLLNPLNNELITVPANKEQFQQDLVQTMNVVSDVRRVISQNKISPMDALGNAYSHYDRAKILGDVAPYSTEFKNEFELAKQEGIASQEQLDEITSKINIISGRYDFHEYQYRYHSPEELAAIGVDPFQATVGKTWEYLTHSRDMLSTKLFGFRSAIETYEQNFAYGINFQDWSDPIGTMLSPKLKAMQEEKNLLNAAGIGASIGVLGGGLPVGIAGAIAGGTHAFINNLTGRDPRINPDTEELRNIEAQAISLEYIKNMRLYEATGDRLYLNRAGGSILSPHQLDEETLRRLSTKAEKPFIRQFLQYNNPELRKRVIQAVPNIMRGSINDFYSGKMMTDEGISPFDYIDSVPDDNWLGWDPAASISDAELVEMDIRNKNARLILKGWDYDYRSIARKPTVALGFRSDATHIGFDMPDWW